MSATVLPIYHEFPLTKMYRVDTLHWLDYPTLLSGISKQDTQTGCSR